MHAPRRKAEMAALFTRVEAWYAEFSEEGDQVFQQFQAEWKDLALRECEFQSGAFLIDTGAFFNIKGCDGAAEFLRMPGP